MARKNTDKSEPSVDRKSVVSRLMDKLSISLYGTTKTDDVDQVNDRFNEIIKNRLDRITDNGENSLNSFLGKLYTSDRDERKKISGENILDQLQLNAAGTNPQDFFTEHYKNRMTKQALSQDISNQLIELRHAKEIMADVIVSADTVTGSVARKLSFKNVTLADPTKDYMPLIEAMEDKFKTLDKIKKYITPNLLGYGEYYVYTIPYYHLFNEFVRRYKSSPMTKYMASTNHKLIFEAAEDSPDGTEDIHIHTLFEEDGDSDTINKQRSANTRSVKRDPMFIEEGMDLLKSVLPEEDMKSDDWEDRAKSDLGELFTKRITVTEDEIPVPILEEGFDSYKSFADDYISEECTFMEDGSANRKRKKKPAPGENPDLDIYLRKYGAGVDDGVYDKKDDEELFTEEDIKDCYIKMIPPTRMIPIEMMGHTLFYVYIQTSPATPLSTILSYNTQIKTKDPHNKMNMLLDDIASHVVAKFNKGFVKDNIEFKRQIVAALEYYDISNTNIHFQAIPAEYVTAYKINVDVDGHGHGMLEGSLFYANIYMSVYLFKIMTILTKSNDHTVNYIRRSGIDKNLWNDIQDIIRRKQRRKITLNDIFSYTNIVNKAGAGSEEFIGMTKNGDKPIESEIVQGQDVSLDTPLLENTRKDMILGTNVPSAIMNYLNEADFAKSIETANTKMNAAAVSFQMDMNNGHTDWYHKLLRYSTNIPSEVVNSVVFTLDEPRGTANIASQELINNYQTLQDFILKLFAGEDNEPGETERRKKFLQDLAELHLNGINFKKIKQLWDDSAIINVEKTIVSDGTEDDSLNI